MKRMWKMMIAMLLILSLSVGLIACAPKPSEKTFKNAQKDAFEEFVDQFLEGYALTDSGDVASTTKMNVKLSEELLTMLRSLTGEQMNWINDLVIQLDQNAKDGKMEEMLFLGYKDKELLSVKLLSDLANGKVFIGVPILSKKYLSPKQNVLAGGATAASSALMSGKLFQYLPAEKDMEKLLNRYYDLVMNAVTGVTFESGKLSAGGVEQECTVYKLELTVDQLQAIAKEFLEALKKDEDLKKVVYDLANGMLKENIIPPGETADGVYNEFVAAIDDALEDLAAAEKDNTVALKWTTYMTKKSETIGTKLELLDEESAGTIFVGKAQNGENIGVEVYVESEGKKALEIKGELTEKKQVQNGTYELKVDGKSMLFVDVKDLSAKQLEEGYIDGTFKICPSKGLIDEIGIEGFGPGLMFASMAIEVDVAQTKEQTTLAMTLLNNGAAYVGINLEIQEKKATDVTLPSDNEVTDNTKNWVQQHTNSTELKNQLKNSGLPASITEQLDFFVDEFLRSLANPYPFL